MALARVLIVDDEKDIRSALRDYLHSDYDVIEGGSLRDAEEAFAHGCPDAAVVDHHLPDGTALELLARLRRSDSSVPVIVLTAYGSIELAVEAMRNGAEYFLTKPAQLSMIKVVLQRALENQRSHRVERATKSRNTRYEMDPFLGASAAVCELAEQARRLVDVERPLLILGETGAGKGVLAGWLHKNGPRANQAFVDLNCAGLSRELLESEVFGHERGAFTGAVTSKPGLLEVGNKGTVFLDEIGDIDLQVQPKLLKVLEEKKFRRIGELRDRHFDARLIAATHQDLMAHVAAKQFRSDLYFRISTVQLCIPPLRQRPEDIPAIAERLLARFAPEMGRGAVVLSTAAMQMLKAHSWPGNIRELRNVLERAVILSGASVLEPKDMRFDLMAAPPRAPDPSLVANEKRHIQESLQVHGWKVRKAAESLGLSKSALYRKIKDYDIQLPSRAE